MKAVLKLGNSTLAIVIFTSLCFMSNYSQAQGLLGKIKKIQEDVKKTTDDAKKIKDDAKKQVQDVKNVTGTGGNGSGGSNGNSGGGSTGNVSVGGSGSNGNTSSNSNDRETNPNSVIPTRDEDFMKKITISNLTGKKIFIRVHLYDDKINAGSTIKPIPCEGTTCLIDLESYARQYYAYDAEGRTIRKNPKEGSKGKYSYEIQANFDDGLDAGGGNPDPFSTVVSFIRYNGDDFKRMGNVVKIEISEYAKKELAQKEKIQQGIRDANDPTKLGTITIVNAVGGKGKIYCVLEVPSKQNSFKVTKMEFMLGENKGDKYVIKNLRLFDGYRLNSMPESEKAKDPAREGILFITNSLSGNSMDSFKMEDGLIGKVGVGMNR
jgi:hypothetical protein